MSCTDSDGLLKWKQLKAEYNVKLQQLENACPGKPSLTSWRNVVHRHLCSEILKIGGLSAKPAKLRVLVLHPNPDGGIRTPFEFTRATRLEVVDVLPLGSHTSPQITFVGSRQKDVYARIQVQQVMLWVLEELNDMGARQMKVRTMEHSMAFRVNFRWLKRPRVLYYSCVEDRVRHVSRADIIWTDRPEALPCHALVKRAFQRSALVHPLVITNHPLDDTPYLKPSQVVCFGYTYAVEPGCMYVHRYCGSSTKKRIKDAEPKPGKSRPK